jgi:hypothetical protein
MAGLGSARLYLAEQAAYDLWQAQHRNVPAITRLDVTQVEVSAPVNG